MPVTFAGTLNLLHPLEMGLGILHHGGMYLSRDREGGGVTVEANVGVRDARCFC